MEKRLAGRDQAGASAAAEGRRAQRAAARRGLGTAALAFAAVALGAFGLVAGGGWFVAGGVFAAALAWWARPPQDPERWHRGAAGEVATARLLARLPRRFVVLHDRHHPGSRGNLDHVVLGPSGVWVIDSKVRRAPLRIHRGRVWAGDHPLDVEPVARQAAWVEEALGMPVAAIMAVHGSGLRRRGKVVAGVRIIPAYRLTRRLRRPRRLSPSDTAALAVRLDRLFPPR